MIPLLWEVGGQVLWMGNVREGLIAPDGESWDEVLLVHYPSRRAFVRMVTSEAYGKIGARHRTAALAELSPARDARGGAPGMGPGDGARARARQGARPAVGREAMTPFGEETREPLRVQA